MTCMDKIVSNSILIFAGSAGFSLSGSIYVRNFSQFLNVITMDLRGLRGSCEPLFWPRKILYTAKLYILSLLPYVSSSLAYMPLRVTTFQMSLAAAVHLAYGGPVGGCQMCCKPPRWKDACKWVRKKNHFLRHLQVHQLSSHLQVESEQSGVMPSFWKHMHEN